MMVTRSRCTANPYGWAWCGQQLMGSNGAANRSSRIWTQCSNLQNRLRTVMLAWVGSQHSKNALGIHCMRRLEDLVNQNNHLAPLRVSALKCLITDNGIPE